MLRLFRYQHEVIRQMLDHIADIQDFDDVVRTVVVDAPTGSGKTVMTLSALYCFLRLLRHRQDYHGVLVLTPFGDVRDNFLIKSPVHLGQQGNLHEEVVDLRGFVRCASGQDICQQMLQHLLDPPDLDSLNGRVLVATQHAAVALMKKPAFPRTADFWKHWIVLVDEAHHATVVAGKDDEDDEDAVPHEETEIGRFTDMVRRLGAIILMTTATPYRRDTECKVYPEGSKLISVCYSDVVEQAGAPSQLKIDLVGPNDPFGLKDTKVNSEAQLNGSTRATWKEGQGCLTERDAKNIALRWQADGYPKAFVRVLRVSKTRNVELLQKAFAEVCPGTVLFDATGPSERVQKGFNAALAAERQVKSYADSKHPGFIVCRRGTEGTDWPLCSHVYNIGLPSSIPSTAQSQGRTFRPKRLPDYPEELRDISCLVCFAPNMSEKLDETLRRKWRNTSLLLACFMHNHETAREFVDHVNRRIRLAVQTRAPTLSSRVWTRIQDAIARMMPTDLERAKATQALAVFEIQFRAERGRNPSEGDVVRHITKGSASPREKIAALLVVLSSANILNAKEVEGPLINALKGFADAVLGLEVAGPVSSGVLDEYLLHAFERVATNFDHMTNLRVEELVEIESRIRGSDTRVIGQALRKELQPAPPFAQVVRALLRWYERHRGGAAKVHGDLSRYFGYPKGSYSKEKLSQDLRAGKISGQPENVRSLDDVLAWAGIS